MRCMDQTNPPKDLFPDLFILCTLRQMISHCWTVQGWNLYFRRLLNDWEIDRVAKLLEELGDFAGTNTDNDVVRWSHSKDISSQLAGHIKRSATCEVTDTRVHGKISGGLQHQQKLNVLLGWSLERHA